MLASLALLVSLSLADGVVQHRALPPGWSYTGCYTEVPGRTLSSDSLTDPGAMTVEECLAYCDKQKYHYAGVEYYNQCCK